MSEDLPINKLLCSECDQKIDRKEWNKTYYNKNKDKLREKYYEKKALQEPKEKTEKINKFTVREDGKIKKEFHKKYNDNYTNKNKDKVITCECGIDYKFFSKCMHLRSKKHKENMSNITS